MIKPKPFLLLLLLLPYLLWVVAAIFSLFLIWPLLYTIGIPISFAADDIPALGKFFGAAYAFILVYVFGILFWGVPYTLFAIGFFFWSKNQSVKRTSSALLYSPVLLALISAIGLMVLGLASRFASGKIPPLEDLKNLGLISLLGLAFCLVYGYILVGVGAAGYKVLNSMKLLRSEFEIDQDISDLTTGLPNDRPENESG